MERGFIKNDFFHFQEQIVDVCSHRRLNNTNILVTDYALLIIITKYDNIIIKYMW